MKKLSLIALCVLVVMTGTAQATSLLVNGDWSAGEAGWTRWFEQYPSGGGWSAVGGEGTLSETSGIFGWYQAVEVPAGQLVTLDGLWHGNIASGSPGWATVILFSVAAGTPDATIRSQVESDPPSARAFKKDSYGVNPPDVWTLQPISLSPTPGGNAGSCVSSGIVVVGLSLGQLSGASINVSWDNLVLDAPGMNSPPTAVCGGPPEICVGMTLNLDGTASFDPDSDPLTYEWDLDGDGLFDEATGPMPSIPWASLETCGWTCGNTYVVTLKVDDGYGGLDADVMTVEVIAAPSDNGPVPEPAALGLLGLALLGLSRRRQ